MSKACQQALEQDSDGSPRFIGLSLDFGPTKSAGFFLNSDWLGVGRRCSGWRHFVNSGFLSGFTFESSTWNTILESCHLHVLGDINLDPFLGWPSLLVPNDDDLGQRSRSVFLVVLFTLQLQSLLSVSYTVLSQLEIFRKLSSVYLLSALFSGLEEPV